MKEKISIKKGLALLLALTMVISGMTIPEKRVTAAEETTIANEATKEKDASVEYVAQIGEQSYATFAEALEAANGAEEDVTLKLLADIELAGSVAINNTKGKNITIDGANGEERYTLKITSTEASNPSIKLHQMSGSVTFQNMDIEHDGNQMLFRFGENTYVAGTERNLEVNMKNMNITSTSTYAYCLMGTQALGQFDINMTDVNVNWNKTNTYSSQRAFLRCGDGKNNQTVNLTATRSTIDLSGTTQTKVMHIMSKVSGEVELNDTDIVIPGAQTPIYANSGTVTITSDADCTFTRVYKVNSADEFKDAFAEGKNANVSTEDVIIRLLADIELTEVITINNTNGKNITIDGSKDDARHTLTITTTGAGNHSIKIHQISGNITFQNMNIVHGGDQMLLRLGEGLYSKVPEKALKFNMENVDITSTSSYTYCLMATQDLGQFDIDMTNVNVDWSGAYGHDQRAFLRCGNGTDAQVVNLTATGCKIDVADTTKTQGMYICAGVSGEFELNNTSISVPGAASVIYTNGGTATITSDADCTFTRVYKVGTADELTTAMINANASAQDVLIKVTADIEIEKKQITIYNTNGKNITIDGTNGNERYTLTLKEPNGQAILVHQASGVVAMQNLNIKYEDVTGGYYMLMRIGEGDKYNHPKDVTVKLQNMSIESNSQYPYCLMATQDSNTENGKFDIDMENVIVKWTGNSTTSGRAFMRCGDNSHPQNVDISMTGCSIDVSETSGTQGFYICSAVSGKIELVDTEVITPGAKMYTNTGGVTVNSDEDCTFIYKVDDATEFTTALANANASAENVKIKLEADITLDKYIEINNTNGKNITIDGAKGNERYALTMNTSVQSILVNQKNGNVTFQNMNIIHEGSSLLLRLGNNTYGEGTEKTLGVVLENVDITSTSTYSYCLMATQALGQFDIMMTNVNVRWNGPTSSSTDRAFLRCGDGKNSQTVNLTTVGCLINVADTKDAQGINIKANVSGNFNLKDTDIITTNVNTYANAGKVKFSVDNDCEFSTNGGAPVVKIGDQTYLTFKKALQVANASTEDVTIKLLADVELTEVITINNTNEKNITIDGAKDGANHTLKITTTGAGNHSIKIHQISGNITFQNMNIVHGGDQMLLRLGEGLYSKVPEKALKFNMENVDITSTSSYTYCLMATQDLGQFDIDMTNVNVDWSGAYGHDQRAFLRCGNGTDAQVVNLTATGCKIDVADTTKTQGMYICSGVSGEFELYNTDILTPEGVVAYTNKGSVVLTYVYGVNTAEEFKAAVENAKTSAEHMKIKLLADMELTDAIEINNAKGKNITIDGANGDGRHTLKITTTKPTNSSNHSIRVHQKKGNITFQNMNIVHGGDQMVFRMGEDKYTEATKKTLNVTLENMDITSTSTYTWCLMATQDLGQFDITMTNVKVDWNGDDASQPSRAFLRCGKGINYAQTVNLTATECTIDVSKTTKTQGMYICEGVSGAFVFKNTDIITPSVSVIYTNNGAVEIDVDDECNGIPDGCRTKIEKYDNVTAFKTSKGYIAPSTIPTGYVFAGWYTDKSCTAESALSKDDVTTSAWAKFVPDHVIDVKAQLSENLLDGVEGKEKGTIRFVTTVDSTDYKRVGFEFKIVMNDKVIQSGTNQSIEVYRELYAVGSRDGEAISYSPETEFCAESRYFKTLTIKGIPQSAFDAEITVKPFWVTLNGIKVYGDEVTKTINEGLKATDGNGNIASPEVGETKYTNRIVLLADTHYMTDNPGEDDAASAGMILGYTQVQKISFVKEDLSKLAATKTVDGVLVLGDLATDDYGYRNLSDNYVQKFKDEVMSQLPGVAYALPGNHDTYPNDMWNGMFGYDRQYSVKIGDAAFIMLDTYADLSQVDGSGSKYTGIDVDWLEKELEKYPTEKIFLCCHNYAEGANADNDAKLKELITGNERIVCMFKGHSHSNGVYTPDSLAGISLIDIGGYAYNVSGETQEGEDGNPITVVNYNKYGEKWAWGYQVLEWNEEEVHLYHVKPARTYEGTNGIFNFAGTIENDIVIKIK